MQADAASTARPATPPDLLPPFLVAGTDRTVPGAASTWRAPDGATLWPDLRPFDPASVDGGARGPGRYRAALPLGPAVPIALGEGGTPLLAAALHGREVLLKHDYLQPTGSYKDRGSAVLAGVLRAAGAVRAVEDSSGNAGASLAAYLGHVGIRLELFVPRTVSRARLRQASAYGAVVDAAAGTRAEAGLRARAALGPGAVYASHVYSPLFMAGVATLAFELWEDLGGRPPGAVYAPVGHGGLLLALYLGFASLCRGGAARAMPRLVGVQAAACAPIARAFEGGPDAAAAIVSRRGAAAGVMVADPPRAAEVVSAVRATAGRIVAVGEAEIARARALLASRGWYVEPAGAVAAAGLAHVPPDEGDGPVVVLLTGSGLKQ